MAGNLPKLIVIGYGRHGKDTFCEIATNMFGFSFVSSSWFCADTLIFPTLKDKYGYQNVEECYNDRHKYRGEWFDLIADYNKNDPSLLGKQILSEYDIYCGLRRKEELLSLLEQGVCDYVIWVDASDRLPPEDVSSCTVTPDMADVVVYNNDSYDEFVNLTTTLLNDDIITRKLSKNDRYRS